MSAFDLIAVHAQVSRLAWVDYAKGLCIVMVVMMHSTLDYGIAVSSEGWLHHLVAFARPFRMPGFFLLAGIFLSRSINSPLRDYVDRKLVHFFYFYLLWLVIHLSITESGLLLQNPVEFLGVFAYAWIEPVNTLWFVHMLAIFYMMTRLLRRAPRMLILLLAGSLQIAFSLGWINTGWSLSNRFFTYYVYFFAGYALAPWIFTFARSIPARPRHALLGLVLWAVLNAVFTITSSDSAPGVSLLLGFAGAAAIVTAGSLLSMQSWTYWLRYCGANSIVIYLSFFLPMKVALILLSYSGAVPDVGTASVLITVVAVLSPLLFHWVIKDTWGKFLYERPPSWRLHGMVRSGLRHQD
ncbi:MAG: acyltransferase family protein [Gammaproteobacteria bacterium]|nr:acyltransferase family protein [Gammaproteobacteria bacterium]MDP2140721.1 acyltransferase family protein [Gammaproteobacteria bacterium]MDP2346975.1 acyltransferase family protein [Gammaproteobacteria bacterium]